MQKAKQYDWQDSNLALFGSDTEKQVKKEAAESEPAWKGCGQKVGLQIWRIVKFKVEHWDKDQYGSFYEGDSYILLNTYKEKDSDELNYDIHFWIGKYSTQDEYGTAAYKTVELDTYLDDKPVQHREVMHNESDLFKSYFDDMMYLSGGADSGFRHVKPEEYCPRLLQCYRDKKKKFHAKEVCTREKGQKFPRSKLDSGDIFILDTGDTFYQWIGKDSDRMERFQATQHLQKMSAKRPLAKKETLDEEDISPNHPFYNDYFTEDEEDGMENGVEEEEDDSSTFEMVLYRLSNASGVLDFSEVSRGSSIYRSDLKSEDVFILDTGKACYVWIGKGADPQEKSNGITYATNYLKKTCHKKAQITSLKDGQRCKAFDAIMVK